MGRRKTPLEIKLLSGTYRPDRDGALSAVVRAVSLDRIPTPPRDLSANAKAHWKEAAGLMLSMGTLTSADLPSLRHYAETQDEIATCNADLAKNGWTQRALVSQMESHRPTVARRAAALDRLLKLFSRFGFTPADRVGLPRRQATNKPSGTLPRQR